MQVDLIMAVKPWLLLLLLLFLLIVSYYSVVIEKFLVTVWY